MAREEGGGKALRRQMGEMLAIAAQDLEDARAGAKVHAARKRLKTLRSLLRLAREALDETGFAAANRELKRAADSLAVARRAEAMVEAVQKLAPSKAKPVPVLAVLEAAARAQHKCAASPAQLEQAVAEARQAIEAVRAMLPDWRLPDDDLKPLLKGLRKAYAKARERLLDGLATGHIEKLHEARKSVIHHQHHLEFLSPLWPELIEAWCAELQTLRQALGDLNDLDELEALLRQAGSPFAEIAEKEAAKALIRQRRKRLFKRIDKHVHRLFAERPGALAHRIGVLWEKAT